MKVVAIENVRGLKGEGIAITVVSTGLLSLQIREAFKTDGSATHWCWLKDGSSCPHEVWRAWEAYKVRNILAGKPAYECLWPSNLTEANRGGVGK